MSARTRRAPAVDHEAAVTHVLARVPGVVVADAFPPVGSGRTVVLVTSSAVHAAMVLVGHGTSRVAVAERVERALAPYGYEVTKRSHLDVEPSAGTVYLTVEVAR